MDDECVKDKGSLSEEEEMELHTSIQAPDAGSNQQVWTVHNNCESTACLVQPDNNIYIVNSVRTILLSAPEGIQEKNKQKHWRPQVVLPHPTMMTQRCPPPSPLHLPEEWSIRLRTVT